MDRAFKNNQLLARHPEGAVERRCAQSNQPGNSFLGIRLTHQSAVTNEASPKLSRQGMVARSGQLRSQTEVRICVNPFVTCTAAPVMGRRRKTMSSPISVPWSGASAWASTSSSKPWNRARRSVPACPTSPTKDPDYRILKRNWSRYTHCYLYIRDRVLGPSSRCGGSFMPF